MFKNKGDTLTFLKDNSKKEWYSLKNYFDKENVRGKIAIVDIGWNGTMQKAISNIIPELDIYGYYMGIVPEACLSKKDFAKGFLFDENHGKNVYKRFHYFIEIFEFLFLAQHGSVKKFCLSDKYVELYDYEYENSIELKKVIEMQYAAINYISDNKNTCEYLDKKCYRKLLKKMLYPKMIDAIQFGDIKFCDDEEKYIAKPKMDTREYFLNLRELKEDFIQASWRIGFLKRVLKIKLPYYHINQFLRMIFINNNRG